jgi:hypothetical protein
LAASAATCAQVNLSWTASQDEAGGSGLKTYIVTRTDPGAAMFRQVVETKVAANRVAFSDTNYVRSGATVTYTVAAQDYAGNRSSPSNIETVSTPACPDSPAQQVVGNAHMQPLGKSIASYGTRSAVIYSKQNASLTLDTWLSLHDENTGQSSRFLLHGYPGYRQIETDFLLTSATELWALSYYGGVGGNVVVSQYRLNGSPIPTSATLLSTRTLGDGGSFAKAMIRLQSGALVVAWNQDLAAKANGTVDAGFAYRSPSGSWTVQYPVNIPNPYGGGITLSRIALAQHPADGSVWAFDKRDSFHEIIALHFTETSNNLALDWISPGFISQSADGNNGPQTEFPYLSAVADPVRNAIQLAYQNPVQRTVYLDTYNGMSGIFLKEAMATIATIAANGTKTFTPVPVYMERDVQFGFSVLPDGTMWLAYPPINHATLTWNAVYAISHFNNAWNPPVFVGYNYGNFSGYDGSGHGDPGFMVSRTDRAQVAYQTPDVNVRTFLISGAAPPPPDMTVPTTSITSPAHGSTVTGIVAVTATAADNVAVADVTLFVDGAAVGLKSSAPYTFSWDTRAYGPGVHTLQTVARDSAGNAGYSAPVSSTVPASAVDAAPPVVAILSPAAGSVVLRNSVVNIAVAASDDIGVVKVDIYVDGKRVASLAGGTYVHAWKVPAKVQSHGIQAIAYDASGKSASASITVKMLK